MLVKIEMPSGTKFKYEKNPITNELFVDRVLQVPCPYSYGFVPGTMEPDGDPLDAFVITEQPLVPGCVLNANPVFRITMLDNGVRDDKLVCSVKGDIAVWEYHVSAITGYLTTYKEGIEIIDIQRL